MLVCSRPNLLKVIIDYWVFYFPARRPCLVRISRVEVFPPDKSTLDPKEADDIPDVVP